MRTIVFIDGQNLFKSANEEFGLLDKFPPYDPALIGINACKHVNKKEFKETLKIKEHEKLVHTQTRFYSGIPDPNKSDWHSHLYDRWQELIHKMEIDGVSYFTPELQYIKINGSSNKYTVAEKGVDMRIGLDLVQLSYEKKYDVAIIFSKDSDFIEAVKSVKQVAGNQKRVIRTVSCVPLTNNSKRNGWWGIRGTKWCPFDQSFL